MYGDNIFGIVGNAMKQLRRAKMSDKADELAQKVNDCKSYDEACALVATYLAMLPDAEGKADKEWDEHWGKQDNEEDEDEEDD